MNKIFLAIIATLFSFASCKISTHIHFNKDLSGTVKLEMDMTEFISNMDDSTSGNFLDSFRTAFKEFDTLAYIKNYKFEISEARISLSYDFKNIDDLNKSLQNLDQTDNENKPEAGKFSSSGKKISFKAPEAKKGEEKPESSGDFEDLFPLTFKVSFERKIKKCDNKEYTWNKEGNYIEIIAGAQDMTEGEKLNFTVKLK